MILFAKLSDIYAIRLNKKVLKSYTKVSHLKKEREIFLSFFFIVFAGEGENLFCAGLSGFAYGCNSDSEQIEPTRARL